MSVLRKMLLNGVFFAPRSPDEPASAAAAGGGETTSGNNSGDNFEVTGDFWDDPSQSTEDKPPTQTIVVQQPQQTVSHEDQFNNHLKGLNFTQGIDFNDLSSGDPQKVNAVFNNFAQGVYRQAAVTASKLVNASVSKAVEEAVRKATGSFQADKAMDHLFKALPFTADPAIRPIAENIYAQAMKHTKNDKDRATNMVKKFFQKTASLGGKELGFQPSARPGTQGFRGAAQVEEEDNDWVAAMTGADT